MKETITNIILSLIALIFLAVMIKQLYLSNINIKKSNTEFEVFRGKCKDLERMVKNDHPLDKVLPIFLDLQKGYPPRDLRYLTELYVLAKIMEVKYNINLTEREL
jgi:hypothetical protein